MHRGFAESDGGARILMKDEAKRGFEERVAGYRQSRRAREWFADNQERLRQLFENERIKRFVFEPVQEIFDQDQGDPESAIRSTITQVAVANAVMAGLPGKMGVGVAVSIALEGWMAYVIARRVGVQMDKPMDIWSYLGVAAGVLLTIFVLFRQLLSFAFSLFSVLPGVNPLILAELLVTSFVGVVFWIAFIEVREHDRFRIPKRAFLRVARESKSLFQYQLNLARRALSPQNLQVIASRLGRWLRGDVRNDVRVVRGEIFTAVAMVYLLEGRHESLDGPMGEQFLGAIRDRYSDLATADVGEISDHMQQYDPEQLVGVISLVKGRLFERLVELEENADGDKWRARSHDDMTEPGSDLVFTDTETGTEIEVSLKATDNTGYIEEALDKYPDTPMLTTEEVSKHFGDDASVMASTWSNEELTTVTSDNFEALLDRLDRLDVALGAGTGRVMAAAAALWPFTMAYLRKRIDREQLSKAYVRVLGDEGERISSRVAWAAAFGPIFGWYLLARSMMLLCRAQPADSVSRVKLEARVAPAT